MTATPLEDLLRCKRDNFSSAKCGRGHAFESHQSLTDKALLQCECPTIDVLGVCGELLTIVYNSNPFIQSDTLQ